MEAALSITVAIIISASVYLLLSKSIIRLLIGVVLLSSGVNLLIFTAGRVTHEVPPLIKDPNKYGDINIIANPLPQALILTAIVISFSIFAFILILAYRAYQELGTDNSDEMRLAEPIKDKDVKS